MMDGLAHGSTKTFRCQNSDFASQDNTSGNMSGTQAVKIASSESEYLQCSLWSSGAQRRQPGHRQEDG